MKTLTLSQDQFEKGLYALDDDSKTPFGSARRALNTIVTDRGGIAPRPGTTLIGSNNPSSSVRGLFNFKKSIGGGGSEILIKAYDDELEFTLPNLGEWVRLKDGFTPDKEFGFAPTLFNTDNDDFVYFCNRYEEYQRWRGAYATITEDLVGAETVIKVDSLLRTPIYLTETATDNSETTVTVSTATWATDMWKNFYIYFPGTGKIRKITENDGTSITFDTLGAGPGNVEFQVRQLAFPETGSIIYNGTPIAYTAPDVATEFPVVSAHEGSEGDIVAIVPDTFIAAPRGNRLDTLLGRMLVGNVRQAISRDSAGDIQGSAQTGSVFVSKLLDPSVFTFSATRTAGEGDILNVAYGGGEITDVKAQEDVAYLYKKDYIEAVKYSGDTDDVAFRTPLKPGVGSIGRVIKGRDDHYFMTSDNQYTSIGRVASKDILPQTDNIGYNIKRILDEYNHSNFNGIEFRDRIISSHKVSPDSENNDVMIVYNRQTKSFEGIWTLGANHFEIWQNKLIYGESSGANVWEMFSNRKSDAIDFETLLPFTADWRSSFFNALPIKSNVQAVNSVAIEGYITAGTTFTFSLYKDFTEEPTLTFNFGGLNDQQFMTPLTIGSFLGQNPLGLTPMGSVSEPDADGRRRFSFMAYFPYIYGQYFSTGLSSEGVNQDWEVLRVSLGLLESVSTRVTNTKDLSTA
jgi:hypothetical protein